MTGSGLDAKTKQLVATPHRLVEILPAKQTRLLEIFGPHQIDSLGLKTTVALEILARLQGGPVKDRTLEQAANYNKKGSGQIVPRRTSRMEETMRKHNLDSRQPIKICKILLIEHQTYRHLPYP